jgi:hypothetical protein
MFGEWYQKTNKTEDLTPDQGSTVDFFPFPRLKSIMKGARFADVAAIQDRRQRFYDRFLKRPLLTVSRSFMNVANSVL